MSNTVAHLNVSRLTELLRPVVEDGGYQWVGLQVDQEGPAPTLRLFADIESGMTVDECERLTHMVDPFLEEALEDSARYYLEVSSPGLERPLFTLEDYRRFTGKRARIKLHEALEGLKRLSGEITSVSDDEITVTTDEGTVTVNFSQIRGATLVYVPEKGIKKTFRKGGHR